MQQLTLPPDPQSEERAALAFSELRQEVAYLRRGLEKFTDEHPTVEIPDYTETLNDLREYTQSLAYSYQELKKTPALRTTPEAIARDIVAAGAEARKAEHTSLERATASNAALAKELSAYLERARTANKQTNWLLWTGGLGFVAGLMAMWSGMTIMARQAATERSKAPVAATTAVQPHVHRRRYQQYSPNHQGNDG